jgi:glycosyltransferase involved in cell wall biosynthesis
MHDTQPNLEQFSRGRPVADWHLLDVNSIWVKEFASALSTQVHLHSWSPLIRNAGCLEDWGRTEILQNPPLTFTQFPLQRGWARFPLDRVLPSARRIVATLGKETNPRESVLICTTPFYAPVAEMWPGDIYYYLTDRTEAYPNMKPAQIRMLDRRMCKAARAVFPASSRIANYLLDQGCPNSKITIIPNAARARNLLRAPLIRPLEPPSDLADLPRPIAGVLGNLAGNMDWILLRGAIARTPDVSWAFVGPTDMEIPDPLQRSARNDVMRSGRRVRFTGSKPYGALVDYARSFDVAILPYLKQEPNFSGTSTRFYEHLAACRPILATRAVDELLRKEPLLKLADSPAEIAAWIEQLGATGFQDGFENLRWKVSRGETWEERAKAMVRAVTLSPGAPMPEPELQTAYLG